MAGDQKGDRFQRIIGQRLAVGRVAGDARCPDASKLAAYRDRALAREERAQCERHFAQCARCGGALAALARIDDAVETGGAARTQAAREDNRGWSRLRTPIPIAVFAAVAAILIVVALRTFPTQRGLIDGEGRSELQTKSLASNAASATAKPVGGAALGNSVMAMNEAARAKPEPLRKSYDRAKVLAPPQAAGSLAREQARTLSRDELKEEKTRASELDKQKAESAGAAIGAIATAEAPAPPAAAPVFAASAPAPPSPPAPLVASGASIAGPPSSRGRREAASAPLALVPAVPAAVGSTPGGNAILVEAPDRAPAWAVGAHGAISRYSPATGWVAQSSGVTADLTRGSAPSTTTCWVVGHGGTILRTVDGEHWTKVIAPVSDDFVDVVASSASDATIFAVGGRRFATSDGGATWRPLQ
ncbi:MAG: zf-HC2 domain-containing protein [Candidatus Binataceae bacterium]